MLKVYLVQPILTKEKTDSKAIEHLLNLVKHYALLQ